MAQVSRTIKRPVLEIAAILLVVLLLGAIASQVASAFESSPPSRGLHDDAGVLSDADRMRVEQAIAEVEAAGAPTVVYLRLLHTVEDRAVRDGQALMEAWQLESSPDAHDGFVIFFNLEPDDSNRGEFAIVAGEAHFDGGALPQRRLNRIRDEMTTLLQQDRMADAIVLGLEQTAGYLESGPPVPSPFERTMDRLAGSAISPLNLVALLLSGFLAWLGWSGWTNRPQAPSQDRYPITEPPGDLHPALAGALADGKVSNTHLEATLLELGRRDVIAFEPDLKETMRIRIDNPRGAVNDIETTLLRVLSNVAEEGVVSNQALKRTQSEWREPLQVLKRELERRGWFDPHAGDRRRPLYVAGILALLFGVASFVAVIFAETPYGLVAAVALGLTGLFLLTLGANMKDTTAEGERQAMPWRDLRDGLRAASGASFGEIDLDTVFPYLASLSLSDQYNGYFKRANQAGYIPNWLNRDDPHEQLARDWVPYYVSVHHTFSPPASSGGSSSPGGAASGSGGAGGRF